MKTIYLSLSFLLVSLFLSTLYFNFHSRQQHEQREQQEEQREQQQEEENSLKENPLKENSLKENSLEENPLKENPLKDTSLKENSLKNDSLKNDSLKENPLKNDSLKDNYLKEHSLKENPLEDNSLKDNPPEDNSLLEEHATSVLPSILPLEEKSAQVAIVMGYNKALSSLSQDQLITLLIQYHYVKQFNNCHLLFYEYERDPNDQQISCIVNGTRARSSSWCKLLALNHTLFQQDAYELLLWLDFDSVIHSTLTLQTLLSEHENGASHGKRECELYFSQDDPDRLDDKPCAGVFFVKNSKRAKDFLNEWWSTERYDKRFDRLHVWEQIYLMENYLELPHVCLFNMNTRGRGGEFEWNSPIVHLTHDYYSKEFYKIEEIFQSLYHEEKEEERSSQETTPMQMITKMMTNDVGRQFRYYKMFLNNTCERVH